MQRPTSVTVLGWTGVVLGALTVAANAPFLVGLLVDPKGFLTAFLNWAKQYGKQANAFREYEALVGILDDPVIYALTVGAITITVAVYALLVVGAWQAFALKERGRQLMLAAAVAILVWKGVQHLVDKAVYEPLRSRVEVEKRERGFGISLDLVYSLATLYFMTRPAVRSAMRPESKQ